MENIAVIFGGKSAEFEISLKSATNIINSIDRNLFNPVLLAVDRAGNWFYNTKYDTVNVDLPANDYFDNATQVFLTQGNNEVNVINLNTAERLIGFSAAFPIIHGTYGEDGTLQGFLKALNVPFVGPDVLGSAIAMDKDVTKRLLRDGGVPVAEWFTLYRQNPDEYTYEEIVERLKLPVFVKPANAGSSVGVSKVTDKESFKTAIETAFAFDNKILIEEAVIGKELECAILGNENIEASAVGEIVATKDFYSYDAKYVSSTGANLNIPANIDDEIYQRIRMLAVKAGIIVCCEGLARVDFLLSDNGKLVLNELNTLPGFTPISMYPKLWEYVGLHKTDLITELISLAKNRHTRNAALSIIQ